MAENGMYQDLGLTQLVDDLLWFERLPDHFTAPFSYSPV
jgi:hypothetical protein